MSRPVCHIVFSTCGEWEWAVVQCCTKAPPPPNRLMAADGCHESFAKGQVGMTPRIQGLYNPAFEHDACGVAMVADMHGHRSRDIVDKAITALVNLEHRGAQGAEPHTGDGAGILLQVPDEFLRAVVEFDLPEYGSYATGIAFLPQSSKDAATACEAVEKIAEAEGLEVLGWREVPTDESSLG